MTAFIIFVFVIVVFSVPAILLAHFLEHKSVVFLDMEIEYAMDCYLEAHDDAYDARLTGDAVDIEKTALKRDIAWERYWVLCEKRLKLLEQQGGKCNAKKWKSR